MIFPVIAIGIAIAFFALRGNAPGADAPEAASTDSTGAPVYIDPPVGNGPHNGDPSATNMAAFLALISASEGTANAADPYGVFYGGQTFTDKSCHPCELRSDGTRLIAPVYLGSSYTTAAGRYQITLSTWNAYGGTAYYGDFSNASQDRCCADIIAACGGADLIAAGQITGAQGKLSSQWASFTADRVAANNAAFQSAGGSLTA